MFHLSETGSSDAYGHSSSSKFVAVYRPGYPFDPIRSRSFFTLQLIIKGSSLSSSLTLCLSIKHCLSLSFIASDFDFLLPFCEINCGLVPLFEKFNLFEFMNNGSLCF
ncbi:hypothetical protein QL285_077721 [Trifolium repens]|nr:hypothetical protein QL285_077721 [Trifolium repens]